MESQPAEAARTLKDQKRERLALNERGDSDLFVGEDQSAREEFSVGYRPGESRV